MRWPKRLRALGENEEAQQQLQLHQTTLHSQAEALAEQGDQSQVTRNMQQSDVDYRAALALDHSEPVLA